MGNEDTEEQAKKQHDPLAHLVLDPTVFTVTGTDSWTRLDGKYKLAKQGGAETLEFETYWPRVYTRLSSASSEAASPSLSPKAASPSLSSKAASPSLSLKAASSTMA